MIIAIYRLSTNCVITKKFNKYLRFSHVIAQPSLTHLNERLWANTCGDFNTGEQIADFVRRTTICGSGKLKYLEAMWGVNKVVPQEQVDNYKNKPAPEGNQSIHAITGVFKSNKATLLFISVYTIIITIMTNFNHQTI